MNVQGSGTDPDCVWARVELFIYTADCSLRHALALY